jgi:hypothetical protein
MGFRGEKKSLHMKERIASSFSRVKMKYILLCNLDCLTLNDVDHLEYVMQSTRKPTDAME